MIGTAFCKKSCKTQHSDEEADFHCWTFAALRREISKEGGDPRGKRLALFGLELQSPNTLATRRPFSSPRTGHSGLQNATEAVIWCTDILIAGHNNGGDDSGNDGGVTRPPSQTS